MTVSSSRLPPRAPARCRSSAATSRSISPTPNPAADTDTHQNHLHDAGERRRLARARQALSARRDATGCAPSLAAGPDLRAQTCSPARSPARGDPGRRRRDRPPAARRPSRARRALASLHARCLRRAALAAGDRRAVAGAGRSQTAPVEAALGPIALAAVTLFTEGDFARIKECGGHACGWLFYDTTKNNRRRWCEMEVCGNRAKQKRLAARRRGA